MHSEAVTYDWSLELQSSPEALWPLVADTNRFDRDAGTPPVHRLVERDAELTNARCAVRQSLFGVTLQYEQEPFEWAYPDSFSVSRHYSRGPLLELGVRGRLTPLPTGGTRCDYQVRVRPRSLVGRLAIPLQIGVLYKRTFLRTFRRYDALAAAGRAHASTRGAPKLATGARERLAAATRNLGDAAVADHVVQLLENGDDLVVGRIRPYALADAWGVPRAAALDSFLRSTRAGITRFRWDVLCPLCGIAKASVEHLDELPRAVHCGTCNIDYEANFERSVELCFSATPTIRSIEVDEYCIGSPMATPHVVLQQLVAPGDTLEVTPALALGRHRLRCYELPGARSFVVADDGASSLDLHVDGSGWPDDEPSIAPGARITMHNGTGDEQLVLIERTTWSDEAVVAAEVTALQEFRDLFASEALRPGEQIEVGSMTIVFTDLRGSTQLYQRIGDAVAFGYVMDHFDVLRTAVAQHDGAIVKTIGDAIMAVFAHPADAVRAMLAAQAALATSTAADGALHLKVGIHHGPCIAVTLNGQLDYFGTTVNMAARLEGLADGSEIVLSDAVRTDPDVAALLDGSADLTCTPSTATLKGFDDTVPIHLLRSATLPPQPAPAAAADPSRLRL